VSAGQHTVQPPPTYREKLQRLKQYQQTIPIRHNWGAIDRADIEEFVYDEIERVKRLIENWEEGESTHA
jgi:nicotinamide mononucleotide adenylyltransferase